MTALMGQPNTPRIPISGPSCRPAIDPQATFTLPVRAQHTYVREGQALLAPLAVVTSCLASDDATSAPAQALFDHQVGGITLSGGWLARVRANDSAWILGIMIKANREP